MKCPETLSLTRHDISAYNVLKHQKDNSPLYQEFIKAYDKNPDSDQSRRLAIEIKEKFSLGCADHNTPLAEGSGIQAETMAKNLKNRIDLPDIIFVSPYQRNIDTFEMMIKGWPELVNVKTDIDERLREQDYGLATLYNDWRVFNVLHPDQRDLYSMQGSYWYRYKQGENIPDVRERGRSWTNTVCQDYSGKNVLAVTHHLTLLSIRANLERLNENEFLRLNNEEKPINCGVTIYRRNRKEDSDGRLVLDVYNAKLY